jgi:hypothetical protein
MTDVEKNSHKYRELALYFAIAFAAYNEGTRLATEERKLRDLPYCELEDLWFDLAEITERTISEMIGRLFLESPVEQPGKQTIQ